MGKYLLNLQTGSCRGEVHVRLRNRNSSGLNTHAAGCGMDFTGKVLNLLNRGDVKFTKQQKSDLKFLFLVLSTWFLGVSLTGTCLMILIKLAGH